jgi:hypothetical protein
MAISETEGTGSGFCPVVGCADSSVDHPLYQLFKLYAIKFYGS